MPPEILHCVPRPEVWVIKNDSAFTLLPTSDSNDEVRLAAIGQESGLQPSTAFDFLIERRPTDQALP